MDREEYQIRRMSQTFGWAIFSYDNPKGRKNNIACIVFNIFQEVRSSSGNYGQTMVTLSLQLAKLNVRNYAHLLGNSMKEKKNWCTIFKYNIYIYVKIISINSKIK